MDLAPHYFFKARIFIYVVLDIPRQQRVERNNDTLKHHTLTTQIISIHSVETLSSAQFLRKTTRGRSLCFLCSVPDKKTQKRICKAEEFRERRVSSLFLSCVHHACIFSMQENKKRHDMRLLVGGCLFEDFVRRLDPKYPGADRSPQSRGRSGIASDRRHVLKQLPVYIAIACLYQHFFEL